MNGNAVVRRQEERKHARTKAVRTKFTKAARDGDQFLAVPYMVLESDGWLRASHTQRSLLLHIAMSGLNGKCTASMKYLRKYGWKSESTVNAAVRGLIECGLLHRTRMGRRPNVSACYAVTWIDLQATSGLDAESVRSFRRGAYNQPEAAPKESQRRRTAAATATRQMKSMVRKAGYGAAPYDGDAEELYNSVRRSPQATVSPSDGAMQPIASAAIHRSAERI